MQAQACQEASVILESKGDGEPKVQPQDVKDQRSQEMTQEIGDLTQWQNVCLWSRGTRHNFPVLV